MKVNGKMIIVMVRAFLYGKMEINMKGHGKIIKKMGLDSIQGLMVMFIMGIGKMIKFKEKDYSNGQMEILMMEIGRIIKEMVKEFLLKIIKISNFYSVTCSFHGRINVLLFLVCILACVNNCNSF